MNLCGLPSSIETCHGSPCRCMSIVSYLFIHKEIGNTYLVIYTIIQPTCYCSQGTRISALFSIFQPNNNEICIIFPGSLFIRLRHLSFFRRPFLFFILNFCFSHITSSYPIHAFLKNSSIHFRHLLAAMKTSLFIPN